MKTLVAALVVLLAFAFVGLKDARQQRDAAKAAEEIAQARYAEAAVQSERVADTVTRDVVKVRTLRDSVLLLKTDTALIQKFVYRVDTLVVSCERCAAQLRSFRIASDSLLRAKDLRIASLKPRWRDRCGVSVGYGVFAQSGIVRSGPNISLGCRAWP